MNLDQLRKHADVKSEETEEEVKRIERRIKSLQSNWIWACILIGVAIILLGICHPTQKNGLTLNEFGDWLGGTLASLLSLVGIIYIYIAFLGQKQQVMLQQLEIIYNRIEIKESQEVLKAQQKQMENQNDIQQKQKFESTLYNMIGLYHEIMNSMSKEETGKNFFKNHKDYLKKQIHTDIADLGKSLGFPIGGQMYKYHFNSEKDDLAHYLRVMYRIFKFIDKGELLNEEEKWFYVKTIRGQLSEGELFILFYNAHSYNGNNFREMVKKYNLLKHLPITDKLEFERYYRQGFKAQMIYDENHEEFYPNYLENGNSINLMKDIIDFCAINLRGVLSTGVAAVNRFVYSLNDPNKVMEFQASFVNGTLELMIIVNSAELRQTLKPDLSTEEFANQMLNLLLDVGNVILVHDNFIDYQLQEKIKRETRMSIYEGDEPLYKGMNSFHLLMQEPTEIPFTTLKDKY